MNADERLADRAGRIEHDRETSDAVQSEAEQPADSPVACLISIAIHAAGAAATTEEPDMRVIIFGATGKTGQHAIRRALDDDHHTTAFGRSVDRLDAEDRLTLARGDVFDAEVVAEAVADHDAVIVCLGSTNLRDRSTLTRGTRHIVDAVDRHGVGRLVVVSAAGVGDSWGQIPISSKLMFKTMLRNVFADHTSQEDVVRRSNANWTIVRPAVLSDKLERRAVTASDTGPTKRIHRAALAGFLVDQLDDCTYRRQAVSVTS